MDRLQYKYDKERLNGIRIHGLTDTKINTSFALFQCFCSCPSPTQKMRDELVFKCWCSWCGNMDIELHYEDCPNAKYLKEHGCFRRTVTNEEKREIYGQ